MSTTIGILSENGHMASIIHKAALSYTLNNTKTFVIRQKNGGPKKTFESSDCLIDFTHPSKLEDHLNLALNYKKSLMIGTTGLTDEQLQSIKKASFHIPILYATNTSIGLHLALSLVEHAAGALDEDYDIEIFEKHHNRKVDAPSGTAITLAEHAALGRGIAPPKKENISLERNEKRRKGDIGFSVLRGGDIVGEHIVGFYGGSEHIEITHKALNRDVFAKGALKAALWLSKQSKSGLYSMRDLISNQSN